MPDTLARPAAAAASARAGGPRHPCTALAASLAALGLAAVTGCALPGGAVATGAAAAPGPAAAAGTAGDEAMIRQARRLQTQALARNDLDSVVRHWDPAITIRRALGHPVDGAAAARNLLEPPPGQNPATALVYQRESATVTVSPHWPLAWEEGRWSGHVGSVDARPVLAGRYAAQWVKRDGQWLIRSEVFVALDCADAGCRAAALP